MKKTSSKKTKKSEPSKNVELMAPPLSGSLAENQGAFMFAPTALVFQKKMEFPEFSELYRVIRGYKGAVMWWIGDLVNYGESALGDQFAQVIDPDDYDKDTIRNAAWVCSKIPIARRRAKVCFSIHYEVAGLDEKEQERILEKAETELLTRAQVRKLLSKKKEKESEAEKSIPVQVLDFITGFTTKMEKMIEDKPLEKWETEAYAAAQMAFNSMVGIVRQKYGFKE